MLRAFVYLMVGWILIAVVGGMADVLSLTIMLPATSVVILTHAAFSQSTTVPLGLFVAIALGYLEDLHQGAPIGTLSLAHGLCYLVLRWASGRLAITGFVLRAAAGLVSALLLDGLTLAILFVLADPLGVPREALLGATGVLHWHALATLLVAPPLWSGLDRLLVALKLDDRPPQQAYWTGK
ncbi:hypothetical protein [Paraliomyxa miuraensis]|uniref:hypothetical protein n=1 Tax=Paraliomyxa miuraensis TaxID=376150 RepID=UPI00224F0F55|nr:hypothetical protein [Paraliomyxa miuraensis]MCX4242094.1 hypothetical protein [Paraliomyxa miuraensis]